MKVYTETDMARLVAAAKAVLRRLDKPVSKSAAPPKPAIIEFFGQSKAGKNTQLVEIERLFKKWGYTVFVHQESAEAKSVRDVGILKHDSPLAFETQHLAYNLSNLLDAMVNRVYHMILLNRGIMDNLCYLEWRRRQNLINDEQMETIRKFILSGPWVSALDAIICLTCDVEVALEREYGGAKNVVYGSRMNPASLKLMEECIESVKEYLKSNFPKLRIFSIDTSHSSVPQIRDEIADSITSAVEQRFNISEEEKLLSNMDLLEQEALIHGPEIKLRGHPKDDALRRNRWYFECATSEKDIYLTKKGVPVLTDDKCFHLRQTGKKWLFFYKRGTPDLRFRMKILLPIPEEIIKNLLQEFDEVLTVHKEHREVFLGHDGLILVRDTVENLGEFTEIKATSQETPYETLLAKALWLGFKENDIEHESYLKLSLRKNK